MKSLTYIIGSNLTILMLCIYSCNINTQPNLNAAENPSTRFQCPMKCEDGKTYTDQRSCPVCNMRLVEVILEGQDSIGKIRVDSMDLN